MRRAIIAAMLCIAMCGCTPASKKSTELSRQADNFEVPRRITVFNVRTNEVMWQMTGNFSTQHSAGDLDIIVDRGNGLYGKYYFKLGEWTTYLVEDLSNTDYPPYEFSMEIMTGKEDE